MKTIKDLKKNDKFKFNNTIFIVVRKWISDEKPLIAKLDTDHRFYNEDLEIEIIY